MKRKKYSYIHLGCGVVTPAGWVNVDGSLNALLTKIKPLRYLIQLLRVVPQKIIDIDWDPDILIHNVRNKLPFENNSAAAIYTSHLLEHLYLKDADKLLSEAYRVLMPGGFLRIMVPDLQELVLAYINESEKSVVENSASDRFIKALGFRDSEPPKGHLIYRFLFNFQDLHTHKWMYDFASLRHHLLKAGFVKISRKKRHQSKIKNIKEVEKNDGLIIEAEKPRH